MKAASTLLSLLMEAYPPGPGRSHALTWPSKPGDATYGPPPGTVLTLSLWLGQTLQVVYFDEADCNKTPEDLFREIQGQLR